MGKTILLLLVVVAGVVRCQFFGGSAPSYTRTALGDSVNIASMKLLKETYNAASEKNVVASPLGVLTLLSIYAAGTEGHLQEEILTYLGSLDYRQLESNYIPLTQRYSSMDHTFLTLANKVFLSDQFELQDRFMYTALAYRSDVGKINFQDPKAAADVMNQWSAANTEGKISEPVSPDDVDPAAALALLNVIFFQGHWYVPFNASETKEQQFHVDRSSSVRKPMMHLEQSLYYHESAELGARMVELPYKEYNFRMVVVLPNEVDGLPGVLEKAAEKGLMEDIFQLYPAGADVIFDMPKFEIKSKLDLNELLPKVGVSSIFSEPANDIVKGTGVAVSRALQEAFITVDEEGATAGAFTGFVAIPISSDSRPPPPITFKVDHPFLFAILHDDIVLFTGTYTH